MTHLNRPSLISRLFPQENRPAGRLSSTEDLSSFTLFSAEEAPFALLSSLSSLSFQDKSIRRNNLYQVCSLPAATLRGTAEEGRRGRHSNTTRKRRICSSYSNNSQRTFNFFTMTQIDRSSSRLELYLECGGAVSLMVRWRTYLLPEASTIARQLRASSPRLLSDAVRLKGQLPTEPIRQRQVILGIEDVRAGVPKQPRSCLQSWRLLANHLHMFLQRTEGPIRRPKACSVRYSNAR